jgi:hypothetical protein
MNEPKLQNVSLNNVRELKQPRNNVQQKIAQLAGVRRHLALAKTWSEVGMHVIRVGPTEHTNAVKSLGKTMPANAYEALLSGVKWSSSIEACIKRDVPMERGSRVGIENLSGTLAPCI